MDQKEDGSITVFLSIILKMSAALSVPDMFVRLPILQL